MNEYLTTKELADLLRIKERKVYDLAASGDVPCSKAMGKLLFPRQAIDQWLADNSTGPAHNRDRPGVFLGSHDPLLEWALLESRCGIATFFDGSLDGLDRFEQHEGVATGLHLFDPDETSWNVTTVANRFKSQDIVLVEWAERARGLIVREQDPKSPTTLADLGGKRVIPRQHEAGSQQLFEHLLAEAGLTLDSLSLTAPARTENDAALAVLEDKADATFGLAAFARQYRLGFVPVVTERFDMMIDRHAWFEPPLQTFFTFCRSETFAAKAADMKGYDTTGLGRVRFNA